MSKEKPSFAKPGVYRGDEVYFDCASGPVAGRVLAHGRHGCTIECGKGKRHRVKWDKVLGHKKRSELRYDIVEEGEDGMIVADASGRRRFIGVPAPDAPERLVWRNSGPNRATVQVDEANEPDEPEKPDEPEVMENPKSKTPEPELRKSVRLPKILLWSPR